MPSRARSLGAALAVLAALAAAAPAAAQQAARDRFSVAAFDPAPAGDRFFQMESPELLGHGAFDAALVTDFALNPFVVQRRDPAGEMQVRPIVPSQLLFHVGAAATLWSRWKLSVDMPLGASYLTENANTPEETTNNFGVVGDLRTGLRFLVGGEPGDPFIAALSGYVWLPTGDTATFTGEGKVRGSPRVVLGGKVDPLAWGFAGGFVFRPQAAYDDVEVGSQFVTDTGMSYQMNRIIQLELSAHVASVIEGDDALEGETTGIEIVLGWRARLDDFVFGIGPSVGKGLGSGAALVRGLVTIAYAPLERADLGSGDDDGGRTWYPPPSQGDLDGDGVPDGADACPDVPGTPTHDGGTNGCPDADGDGVLDDSDVCPARPGPAGGARSGCPVRDRDGDGIPDEDDSCADLPGNPSPVLHDNGCPEDSDGDGVVDSEDACPNRRGHFSLSTERNGCPREVKESP